MAKIQITTMEMRTNAQVIVLDASFVAKAVRAQCAIQQATKKSFGIDKDAMMALATAFIDELVDAMLGEEKQPEPEPEVEAVPIEND